ncbi:MAG: hypothetical protein OXP71_02195 [Candidatus Poribacteria bacterium]|nr:hypothetical protein [Candidatus Poribacteria bacterium]
MTSIKTRTKFGYTAFGAFLMLIGMLCATLIVPLNAYRDTFDEIKCNKLTVGDNKIVMGSDGHLAVSGNIMAKGNIVTFNGGLFVDDVIALSNTINGGEIHVLSTDKKNSVMLNILSTGPSVAIISNKKQKAALGVKPNGDGVVYTWDKYGR